jgi:hypothetical protein
MSSLRGNTFFLPDISAILSTYIVLTPFIVLKLCPGHNSKNEQKAITPKLEIELRFFCTALLPNDIYLPTKFLVNTPSFLSYVPDKVQGVKVNKGQFFPKLDKAQLRFFCTVLLLSDI